MEKQNKRKSLDRKSKNLAGALNISTRGRKFEGYVIRKFDKRVTIKFERVKYIRKYERYAKSFTKIHAYLPENLKNEIKIGDYIQIMECRPLSRIMHHLVVKKIRDADINSATLEEK